MKFKGTSVYFCSMCYIYNVFTESGDNPENFFYVLIIHKVDSQCML